VGVDDSRGSHEGGLDMGLNCKVPGEMQG